MAKHAYAVKFSGKVDRTAGIIAGVSVLTTGIAEGWDEWIDATTLAQVCECAKTYSGGLKVVDRHTRSTDSVFSTTGVLKNFRVDGLQLRADLHVMKSEANREKLFEMAEMIPDTFGLSIAFKGPSESKDGKKFARCLEIYNAALVDVPAANPTGLFSADAVDAAANHNPTMTPEEILTQCQAKIQSALVEFGARIKAVEDAAKTFAATTEFAAVKTEIKELGVKLETAKTELAAKFADDGKRIELAAVAVAKEFSRHTGQGARVPTDGGGDPTDPKPGEAFEGKLQKHFAATKSQGKALELAIGEDPKGYKAFQSLSRNIKWAA